MKTKKPIIAVDFDGVIHRYSRGWIQKDIYDPPVDGVHHAMEVLRHKYHVIVFSCRAYSGTAYWGEEMVGQAAEIEAWLKAYEIPFDEVWVKPYKPSAIAYIDDRAITFRGDWAQTLIDVENFRSWIDPTYEELHGEIKQLRAKVKELESRPPAAPELVKLENNPLPPQLDPKSPAGALSGLMARLRTRNQNK